MEVAQPFAAELMSNGRFSRNGNSDLLGELGRQAAQMSNTALGLPRRLEDTLDKLEQGDLRMRVRSQETDRILRRLSYIQMGTNYAVLFGVFTLSATVLLVNQWVWLASIAAIVAMMPGVALMRTLLRIKRYDRYERML